MSMVFMGCLFQVWLTPDYGDLHKPRPGLPTRNRDGAATPASPSAIGSSFRSSQALGFQPVIECIDPVVAARALLSHAEAMAAGAENVDLGFVAR